MGRLSDVFIITEGDVIKFPSDRVSSGGSSGAPAPVVPIRKKQSGTDMAAVKKSMDVLTSDRHTRDSIHRQLIDKVKRGFPHPFFGDAQWDLGVVKRVHPKLGGGDRDLVPGTVVIFTPAFKRKSVWYYHANSSSVTAMDVRDIVEIP